MATMVESRGAQDGAGGGLAGLLRAAAAERAAHPALRSGEEVLTYAALDARVDAVAAALSRVGVRRGDRVAVMLGTRPSFVVATYATLRLGAIVVPINTMLTASEIALQLTDCEAAAMLVGGPCTATVAALRGTLPQLAAVLVADTSTPPAQGSGMRSLQAVLADAEGHRAPPVDVTEDDVALLAYTSGTTGSPKAAVLTHGNLLANQRQLAASGHALGPEDVVMTTLPLFHSHAFNVAMGMALAAGATLELAETFEPSTSLQVVAGRRVTVVVGAPAMYVAWLHTPGVEEVDLSSIRLATSGAAPLPPRVLHRCAAELSLDVRELYGLAEAGTVVASSASLRAPVPGSVGAPLEGVEVRILDDDRVAEPGDPGTISVRGPGVFQGYWRAPGATARVLDDDGWLDTGDIGYLADGLLRLVDRAKDVIIVSGFNVYPAEVEQALLTHADVIQAAVVGVPHPYTGEAVKAFVVLAEGAVVTAEELIAHVGTRVAPFKRPESVDVVASLPTLPTGKVRRRLLRG